MHSQPGRRFFYRTRCTHTRRKNRKSNAWAGVLTPKPTRHPSNPPSPAAKAMPGLLHTEPIHNQKLRNRLQPPQQPITSCCPFERPFPFFPPQLPSISSSTPLANTLCPTPITRENLPIYPASTIPPNSRKFITRPRVTSPRGKHLSCLDAILQRREPSCIGVAFLSAACTATTGLQLYTGSANASSSKYRAIPSSKRLRPGSSPRQTRLCVLDSREAPSIDTHRKAYYTSPPYASELPVDLRYAATTTRQKSMTYAFESPPICAKGSTARRRLQKSSSPSLHSVHARRRSMRRAFTRDAVPGAWRHPLSVRRPVPSLPAKHLQPPQPLRHLTPTLPPFATNAGDWRSPGEQEQTAFVTAQPSQGSCQAEASSFSRRTLRRKHRPDCGCNRP